jgi:hypothetical protein
MGTMAEALGKAGIVTSKKLAEVEEERKKLHQQANADALKKLSNPHRDTFTLSRLEACVGIKEFRATTKGILSEQPELITEVIKSAHRFNQNSGKRLVWILYQLRDLQIAKLGQAEREQILNQALRNKNPKLPEKEIF